MADVLPVGWEIKSINDIASVFAGGTPSRNNSDYYQGDIPWVKSGEVNARQIFNTSEHISNLAIEKSSTRIAPEGSVLLAMYGATAGQVAKLMIDAALNQAVSAINGKIGIAHNDYLIYALEHNTDKLLNTVQGSGQPNLSGQLIKKLKISLPPLSEQKKIASILSSVDEVIEKTTAQVAKLKDLKTSLMQELLSRGIGHSEFKDSPVGRIPVEWEVVKMESICNKITDGEHQTPKRTSKGYYLLSARNIRDGYISLNDVDYIPESEYLRISKRILPKKGDVLISCSGSIGRTAVVPENLEFSMVRSVAILQPKHELINSYFLKYQVSSTLIQSQIEKSLSQLAQANLFQAPIKALNVVIPSIKEQKEIAKILSSIDKKITTTNQKLSALNHTKKALMQDLLTGKKRVIV